MKDLVNSIQQEFLGLLPAKRSTNQKWISFNAVCCTHQGETLDTRKRGGVLPNPDGSVTYHCFNCGFKTGYYPGRPMSFKFRKLLRWMGTDDNTVQRLIMEALRIKELVPITEAVPVPDPEIVIKPRGLPEDSASFEEWATMLRTTGDDHMVPQQLTDAVMYVASRRIDLKRYNFFLTDTSAYNLDKRLIVPFYWKGDLIGYTARAMTDDVKPKYHSNYEANYVFNLDQQLPDAKLVIVTEGPFDAMSIDGVSVLSNECSETQAEIIDSLGRDVVVLPDWDRAGQALIDDALEFGWAVSFPIWKDQCKDVNEAVMQFGKLFVLKSIIDGIERNPVKIKLKRKL
jgi:hypothetical protein